MIGNIGQMRQLQQLAQNPKESEKVQLLTEVIAEIEHRQIEAVEDLHDSLDLDTFEATKSKEDRHEQLLSLVDAIAGGDFRGWWFGEVAAEHLENPEDAKAYAGLDGEEWEAQISRWASAYRESADLGSLSDREIAEQHIKERFGVSLSEFEREVVEWHKGEALRTVLSGNFEAVEQGVKAATTEIEHRNGGEEQ